MQFYETNSILESMNHFTWVLMSNIFYQRILFKGILISPIIYSNQLNKKHIHFYTFVI